MKIVLNIHNIICYAIIIVLAYFLFRSPATVDATEIDRVRKQRDSILDYTFTEYAISARAHMQEADSLRSLSQKYKTSDSINHIKYIHERSKYKNYSPSERANLVDSILTAEGIRSRTR
jgi:hypothetical protein